MKTPKGPRVLTAHLRRNRYLSLFDGEQTSERRARGGGPVEAVQDHGRSAAHPEHPKGRFSQPMPAVGAVDVGDDSTDVGNGRQSSDPPTATSVDEQLPPGAQRAMTSSVAGRSIWRIG